MFAYWDEKYHFFTWSTSSKLSRYLFKCWLVFMIDICYIWNRKPIKEKNNISMQTDECNVHNRKYSHMIGLSVFFFSDGALYWCLVSKPWYTGPTYNLTGPEGDFFKVPVITNTRYLFFSILQIFYGFFMWSDLQQL